MTNWVQQRNSNKGLESFDSKRKVDQKEFTLKLKIFPRNPQNLKRKLIQWHESQTSHKMVIALVWLVTIESRIAVSVQIEKNGLSRFQLPLVAQLVLLLQIASTLDLEHELIA